MRIGLILCLPLLLAGCFQPLYGDPAVVRTAGLGNKLAGVKVEPIESPNGTRLARVGGRVRDDLIYDLTGGSGEAPATHKLDIKVSSSNKSIIVDVNTNRPDVQDYGINATYTLTDLRTGKAVVKGKTFASVSYNIPGQEQRFAGVRGLRDAENRAAKVIADSIHSRLASYFVAGT
ncbi:MAG: LPS assembly lipoprotein LptE [Pseudolabrys sp.]